MRIAVLSDIHANLGALEAVLRDVARRGVEGALHLGDAVGFGPQPNEVLERLHAEGIAGVRGNWDLALLDPDPEAGLRAYLPPHLPEEGRTNYRWTREVLSDANRERLVALPAQTRVDDGATAVVFAHASPDSPLEDLTAETPEARLGELFAGSRAQVLVVGHTHRPLAREAGGGVLLNPGSVGRPLDGDPRASYLILDTAAGLAAEHVRVEFAVENGAGGRLQSGLPFGRAR